jgi:hypothetical protein
MIEATEIDLLTDGAIAVISRMMMDRRLSSLASL